MVIFHRARARGRNGEEVELEGPKEWVEEWMMKMFPFMDIIDARAIEPKIRSARFALRKNGGDAQRTR